MDRELRILILEDDSADAELMQRELRNAGITFSSMLVHSREEFIKGLDHFLPELILADYKLPSFDGLSALDISQEKCPDVPFIFVTGTMGEEWAVETLKRGACDYVIKDRIYRLASVVKRALQDAKERAERKRAEEALRQAEEKYRNIFENVVEGIFQTTPDGRYLAANPALAHIYGYESPAELMAAITDIDRQFYVDPNRRAEFKQAMEKNGMVSGFESQVYRKDRSIIWISENTRAVRDESGRLLFYEGTTEDITEEVKARKMAKPGTLFLRILAIFGVAEILTMVILSILGMPIGHWWFVIFDSVLLALISAPFVYMWIVKGMTRHLVREATVAQTEARTQEHHYHTLVETAPDVIYTLAAGDGSITSLNPAFETITGWSRDEWIGKTFASLVHPEDLPLAMETSQQVLRGENPPVYELRILTKSGEYLIGEFTSVPQFEHGKIVGELGIARDVTERKRAEKALIIAKDRAEESDKLKSAFLANMSHEIRTPMNGILGFSELLKEPGLTGDQQQEYITIIEKSGARMLNIINDIVEFSKIESGLMEVDLKESNINEQIDYIHTFFKPEIDRKGIQFFSKKALPEKEAVINTDREKIYAILTNLIKNAIKYSNEGAIEFGYIRRGETLEFYVKDTGIGIPKDWQNAIFERFIQADITDKMARQGAGLGLSISKAYVEMLGGKIWVESEVGIGSTFYFTLPYNDEAADKNVIQNVVLPEGATNQIKDLKILIAEDDEGSEKLLTVVVKMFGKEVLKARTGVEAIEACRNNPDIDLVFMDIQMPEMNGYEATRQIRQFNKDVVIIAQTAYALTGDRELAIEAGCNDYIAKPINKEKLLSIIHKYFNE